MNLKIKKIQYKGEYNYKVIFKNNKGGIINFQPYLWGEAFGSLKNKSYFQKAYIDKTSGTITWPNGIDIAPETLYSKITSN